MKRYVFAQKSANIERCFGVPGLRFQLQDYIITTYIAEVINTLSNFIYRKIRLFFLNFLLLQTSISMNFWFVTWLDCPFYHEIEAKWWMMKSNVANFEITVFYALHGIKNNANRKDAVLRNLPYLGIAGVGFGSAIFHATLKNYTQWCKFEF